jgi:hypothetical protein
LKHQTSPDFWDFFYDLPADVQELARRNYEILNSNPRHPSLHFKKVGPYWSVRVGIGYRALGIDIPEGILRVWIGSHGDYDKVT